MQPDYGKAGNDKTRKGEFRKSPGCHIGHGGKRRRTRQRVAIPLYGGRKRRCRIYHHLCGMRTAAGNTMHDQRVHHRTPRTVQHGKGIPQTGRRQRMVIHRIHGCTDRIPHHRILCRRGGMVHTVCMGIAGRIHDGITRLLPAVFQRTFCRPRQACTLDGRHPGYHLPHHRARCAQRHRTSVEGHDADAVPATAGHRRCLLHAA